MKLYKYIGLLILFPAFTSFAQLRPGGLTDTDETDKWKASEKVRLLKETLVRRDKICSPQKSLIKDPDLFQIYLRLSLLQNSKVPLDECEDVEKYLACLQGNAEISQKVFPLKVHETGIEWLAEKYKIDQSEVIKMLDFFEKMGKKK